MADLWIRYTDENGDYHRIRIEGQYFTIGRHSSCSLAVANNKLSREHILIERAGERFFVTDRGSSNGTELNERPLIGREEIMNGDRADLGGGLAIEFEYSWDELEKQDEDNVQAPVGDMHSVEMSTAFSPQNSAEPASTGSFPIWLLIVGPLAALLLLIVGVSLLYVFSGGNSKVEISERNDRTSRISEDDPEENRPTSTRTPSTTSSPTSSSTSNESLPTPPPSNLGENAKVEQNAASFLRKIAQNDPKAFLTADQAQKVSGKVKQFTNSSTLAGNIESARKSSAGLKTLAASKNLTPQLLATAALAKLGSNRGDALQTAQLMADILEKLQTQVGSELYDDCLMMIAAYDQGERGDFMRLRNMLQDLATKFPESSRSIRSIWFLQKQGKITDAEFDFALRFLAIGIITQNPKDFGINADPLNF